jgi:hypothetical protein
MKSRYYKHANGRIIHLLQAFMKSVWLFPFSVFSIIFILSLLGVSGSSVGIYDGVLNSNSQKKQNIISTEPRAIRSDEWLVTTQMTVAQYEADFPKINPNIGDGQNMALTMDVPYKDWSILFKPQNIIFLIASLDFAFAFKWWFIGGFLAVSAYFFVLKLLPSRRLEAVLISTTLLFSPFIQWWYLSGTIIPIAVGLILMTLILSLHDTTDIRKRFIIGAAFTYFSIVFAFVLYPPFQIPIVLAVLALYLAYLIFTHPMSKDGLRSILPTISILFGATIVTIGLLGAFLFQNRSTVETIANTVYPGKRVVSPGGLAPLHPFTGHTSFFLQDNNSSVTYKELSPSGSNQSESSNFLLPTIVIVCLALILLVGYKNRIDKTSKSILVGGVLVLVLFFCHVYIPFGQPLYSVLGLGVVPHNRLIIGIGFVSFIMLVCLYRIAVMTSKKPLFSKRFALMAFIAVSLLYAIFTFILSVRNPGFISNLYIGYSLALLTPLWLFFFLRNNLILSLICLTVLSIVSTFHVNPLERNLNEITDTNLSKSIRNIQETDAASRWATNNLILENYAVANGAKSISGVYAYPQLEIWHALDQNKEYESFYNRYAHIIFEFNESQIDAKLSNPSPDTFIVTISPCDAFFKTFNTNYFYSTDLINSRCAKLIQEIITPSATTVHLYKRVSPSL